MNQIKMISAKRWIAVAILLAVLILGIFITMVVLKREEIYIPSPIIHCPTTLDWKTIVPGISTRHDVIEALGKPDDKGRIRFGDNKTIPYYAYNVEGGDIAKYTQHRIFFRGDGRVDWIEAIIADGDGTYHTVQEIVDQLGSTLDTVYTNNNYDPYAEFQYDVLGGPDVVLVWSECGAAVIALWWGPWGVRDQVDPNLRLTLRYPGINEYIENEEAIRNLDGVVMMEFLFQPTTFDGFQENYRYRIPSGLWNDYLAHTRR